MATTNNINLLGKRVGYWTKDFFDYDGNLIFPSVFIEGLVIAVVVQMKGYESIAGNDVLFLEDGSSEPDFVCGDYKFSILAQESTP